MRFRFIWGFLVALLIVSIPSMLYFQTARCALCIGGGGLSITSVPSSQTFGNVEVSTQDETVEFVFDEPIYFQDMRGLKVKKMNRFTLYVTATDFEDSSTGETFDLSNLSMATDEDDTIEVIDCNPITQLTVHQTEPTAFYDRNHDGISNSKILITGQRVHPLLYAFGPFGNFATLGKYSFEPEISLTIPAYTPSGSYQTTLTFTII